LQVDAALAASWKPTCWRPGAGRGRVLGGFAALVARFAPVNRALLETRETIQATIDAWHLARRGQPHDPVAYRAFLEEIGYIVPEPAPFAVGTQGVDPEIATMAGPQLVVPVLNDRFLLNAANARWGSLYDAWYGTDALDAAPARPGGYDPARGAAVIAAGAFSMPRRRWRRVRGPIGTAGVPALADPAQWVGHKAGGLLFRHNGLHIELVIDRGHPVGASDAAGLADIVLEAALTTIVDLEDLIAAVDAEDKLVAYRHWLGLMRGDLTAHFTKGGKTQPHARTRSRLDFARWRRLHPAGPQPAVRAQCRPPDDQPGDPAARWQRDPRRHHGRGDHLGHRHARRDAPGPPSQQPQGSIYIVKPKMHGPEEVGFANDVRCGGRPAVPAAPHLKVGVMDEERRTSANLAACIAAVKDRVVFINTGFSIARGTRSTPRCRPGR
jgi:malate synthase